MSDKAGSRHCEKFLEPGCWVVDIGMGPCINEVYVRGSRPGSLVLPVCLPCHGHDELSSHRAKALFPSCGQSGNRETIVIQKPESRSALSVGYYWCARVTSIGLEFAIPAMLGFYLDRWLNTSPWITVIGAFLGLGLGMSQVLRLAGESSPPIQRTPKISPPGSEERHDRLDSLP